MNLQNFTIKSQEVIQQAQQMAMQFDHQQISNEHILKSLLGGDDEVIAYLLKKLNVNLNYVQQK
ncbi:MAG: Clp protease N-terminal domain-containing protein, partial [Chitinophagales bacterium]